MPDIFLSYSRKDKDFVQKFHEKWVAEGRDAWVDWEDIPLTADWLEEIYQGIRESDAFVFIISPDSVQSEVCGWELQYAVENQKRFIPIMYREIVEDADKEKMHPAINSHNWLFFRSEDDFDKSFNLLTQAVDTDLTHLREHTRLLVRAREWEDKEKSNSYVLQGDDLATAESWLAEAQSKEPHPTQLHSDYIYASRKAANRRQQILMTSALVAAGVSLILAIAAVLGFIEAQNQREIAELNAAISERLAIAANAQREFALNNNDLAIALALQSVDIANPPREALRILEDSVFAPGTSFVLQGHTSAVRAVDFNSDATLLASAADDATVIVWNTATGEQEQKIELGENSRRIRAVAFSPDDSMLAAADFDDLALIIWNTETWEEITRIIDLPTWVRRLEFSPDSTQLLTGDNDGGVILYDALSGDVINVFEDETAVHGGRIDGVDFSSDGSLIASGDDGNSNSSNGTLIIWDVESGTIVNAIATGAEVTGVDFTPDDTGVLTASGANGGFSLRIWDVGSGISSQPLGGHIEFITDVEFDASGLFMFSGSNDTTVRLWSLQTRRELAAFTGHTDSVRDITFSPDATMAASGAIDGTVRIWDLSHGAELARIDAHPANNTIIATEYTPDGSRYFTAGWDAQVAIWDAETNTELFRFTEHDTWILDGDLNDGDGSRLLVVDESDAVVYDVTTGEEIIRFTEHTSRVRRASLSPDGTIAITGELDDIILIWNVDTGEILNTLELDNNAEWIEFNADGSQWLYATTGGDLFIVDYESGEVLNQFNGIADFARYTPDGTGVLVINSNRAFIIDLATGEETISFEGHNSEIFSVDFSNDGVNLITGSSDGTIRLWDLATGRELRIINVGTEVYVVTNAPGENHVLSANYTLRLWDITPPTQSDIVTWANNNRYIRTLDSEECIEYRIQSCTP